MCVAGISRLPSYYLTKMFPILSLQQFAGQKTVVFSFIFLEFSFVLIIYKLLVLCCVCIEGSYKTQHFDANSSWGAWLGSMDGLYYMHGT